MTLVDKRRLGEVVQARTADFVGHCYQLDGAPAFGSLVKASDGRTDIFGIVSDVTTGSMDTGRRVSARGVDEATEEDLFTNNPEISMLLKTEFTAITVGFRDGSTIAQRLPATPPRLHGFVFRGDDRDLRLIGAQLDFLGPLLNGGTVSTVDELIGATLRQIGSAQVDPRAFLVAAGKRLAILLENDMRRLATIVRSAQA